MISGFPAAKDGVAASPLGAVGRAAHESGAVERVAYRLFSTFSAPWATACPVFSTACAATSVAPSAVWRAVVQEAQSPQLRQTTARVSKMFFMVLKTFRTRPLNWFPAAKSRPVGGFALSLNEPAA